MTGSSALEMHSSGARTDCGRVKGRNNTCFVYVWGEGLLPCGVVSWQGYARGKARVVMLPSGRTAAGTAHVKTHT